MTRIKTLPEFLEKLKMLEKMKKSNMTKSDEDTFLVIMDELKEFKKEKGWS